MVSVGRHYCLQCHFDTVCLLSVHGILMLAPDFGTDFGTDLAPTLSPPANLQDDAFGSLLLLAMGPVVMLSFRAVLCV